ncbi:MAG: hypothetical protein H6668_24075 [Ardenticatenaceae bacterium]|nr:hypothetical protein [Ardenticatenaceae bacterium]
MNTKFGLTNQSFNTQYAPLGMLLALYKQKQVLKPLENVTTTAKIVRFSQTDKLEQVLVSILGGCDTLSEVNVKLCGDVPLANAGGWERFADQSTLSLALDSLSQMNIEQLRGAVTQVERKYGATPRHDWRGFLWLDYDLSGLICSQQAEKSTKGFFSGKKTPLDGN